MSNATPDIWRVEWVLDTRDRDNNRKPIPGTGDKRTCEQCGRTHEVHACVSLRGSNVQRVVGVSCARKLRGVWGCLSGNYVVDKLHPNYGRYAAKLAAVNP